jgi:hypothetical protein
MKMYIKKRSVLGSKLIVLIIALSTLLASCKGGTGAPNLNENPEPAMETGNLSFRQLAQGDHSNYAEPRQITITSQSELEQVVEKINQNQMPGMEIPMVDFSDETVVFATSGQLSTGGYTIEVEKIVETPNSVQVFIGGTSPAEGDYVTTVLTSPYILAAFKKKEKPVAFKGNLKQ